MTDLLLISDVPRLSAVFTRLTDDKTIRLRTAASLEKGGEELAAEKPGIVFVQTHLSGLSADILLKHLKKQLGRKRSKFVLLSIPSQGGEMALDLYQGHLDISQDDEELLKSIKALISTLLAKKKKTAAESFAAQPDISTPPVVESAAPLLELQLDNPPAISSDHQEHALPEKSVSEPTRNEPSLAEQGITYAAPRSRLSVYSEFNSSFDTAVSNTPPAEPLAQMPAVNDTTWRHEDIEVVKPEGTRSKRTTFLLWLAPVVIAVIVVTMLQHKRPKSEGIAIKPDKKPTVASPTPATPAAPTPQATPVVAATQVVPTTPPAVSPAPSTKPAVETDARLGDKAVLSAIAENRGTKENASTRPTALPDFIPRSGQDKTYGAANPGWERYKGQVTEFKVFREGGGIKAIQIVDRGGKGIPESFMKGVLTQVGSKSGFIKDTTEKKEGYEIHRGRITENLSVVMYRDGEGGRLRAFVLTWQ